MYKLDPMNTVLHREGMGSTSCITQGNTIVLKRVMFEIPTLLFVKEGRKTLWNAQGTWVVNAGQAIAIAGNKSFDLENRPATSESKLYHAEWLSFDSQLLTEFSRNSSGHIQNVLTIEEMEPSFIEAFERARGAIIAGEELPGEIALLRMKELLTWLQLHGGTFSSDAPDTLSYRVRDLIASEPGLPWVSSQIARHMAMSEATLRRHLASERISLSELLLDVRMNRALGLIQNTDAPIYQIASIVGYGSPSKFSVRFKKRFGHSPHELRSGPL